MRKNAPSHPSWEKNISSKLGIMNIHGHKPRSFYGAPLAVTPLVDNFSKAEGSCSLKQYSPLLGMAPRAEQRSMNGGFETGAPYKWPQKGHWGIITPLFFGWKSMGNWGCNPYKWPTNKWVTGVLSPLKLELWGQPLLIAGDGAHFVCVFFLAFVDRSW